MLPFLVLVVVVVVVVEEEIKTLFKQGRLFSQGCYPEGPFIQYLIVRSKKTTTDTQTSVL